jgi:hypothetical protein
MDNLQKKPWYRLSRENYIFCGALLFAFILILYTTSCIFMKHSGMAASIPLEQATDTLRCAIENVKVGTKLTAEQLTLAKTQNHIIYFKKQHYLMMGIQYYANYFAATVVSMFSSICGAIMVFLVAYRGWGQADKFIRAMFIVFFFSASFWGLFPSVFVQDKNSSQNFKRYAELDKIQIDLFNFLSLGGGLGLDGKAVRPDSILTDFNRRIVEQCDFTIGIDASSIQSMNDIAKKLPGGAAPVQ